MEKECKPSALVKKCYNLHKKSLLLNNSVLNLQLITINKTNLSSQLQLAMAWCGQL